MALTPESTRALRSAINTIVESCGDDPQYQDLIGKLKDVQGDLHTSPDAGAPKEERDGEDDDYSFETAAKRHKERTAAKHAAESEPDPADPAEKEGDK